MPEYLAPGVFVEEVSFRSKSIEGVPTSTTGFVGVARYGPVRYLAGPLATEARLITSFTEYESVYGGLDALNLADGERPNYMAHAARAFFANGGKRLYISRVIPQAAADAASGVASANVPSSAGNAQWLARWPGDYGNVLVETRVTRSRNVAFQHPAGDFRNAWGVQARGALDGAVVERRTALAAEDATLNEAELLVVRVDPLTRQQTFWAPGATVAAALPEALGTITLSIVELRVEVNRSGGSDFYAELGADAKHRRYIGKVLERDDPQDENAIVWLRWNPVSTDGFAAARLAKALQAAGMVRLAGGADGALPGPVDFEGKEADPDDPAIKATGLHALGEVDDIAIVAMPDLGRLGDADTVFTAAQALVTHAETLKYRIAIVDGPYESSLTEIRGFRGRFDSKYAALYHPWIEILDPMFPMVPGTPPRKLLLPPSGFVAGIYARNDIERGVHKAPANEIVRGLTKFEVNINKARQEVLNPEGVNCLRFFEGRGNRVWGARTMSSDPEWKYVNVRRLFIYLEHSLDKATQWAVFEPNNERLWKNIKQTVEDFLLVMWRDGWLVGEKPENAYFVRCDRTTMLQNDLDNGRMICLVGVAPSRPAEFVIFRVGQWTADAKM